MEQARKVLPGLTFLGLLTWISMQIQQIEYIRNLHLSAFIIAIILGMLIRNIMPVPPLFQAGINFSFKKVLRLAIVLLGFKLSFAEVGEIGTKGFLLVLIVTATTIFFTLWLGNKISLDRDLTLLIAAGSSICGASAVAAVAPVINAKERDTTFAVATVTIFGTLSMFLYPILYRTFHLPGLSYAVWTGASIHEVAQVVAAGFAAGEVPGQFATLVKLSRVLLIIPVTIILGISYIRRQKDASWDYRQITIPWFVFGFLAVVMINSLHIVPASISTQLITIDNFLLTFAMAGMGLETSLEKMKKVGLRPFYLGLLSTIFISVFGFILSNLMFA